MSRSLHLLILLFGTFAAAGCSMFERSPADRAQLFTTLGPHRRAITTDSELAQQYFDQGLTWTYAFNHDEAISSFHRAAQLDPECAMPWWGVALCEGPNYNDPMMTDERSANAWNALQEAVARIDNTTPVERALIEALQARYAKPWPEDRAHLEQAYADAMAEVYAAYPDDSDVGTLYAESMMVLTPWKLYTPDFAPGENTLEIEAVLERVMEMNPENPGANHLYIHTVEPSADPDRGVPAADRLCDLVPTSGHLDHMPSHIYVKTGRWQQSIRQNEKAMVADERYLQLAPDQTIQHMYMVHNSHMLAYSAMMVGREQDAMAAARTMWAQVPDGMLDDVGPFIDQWMSSVYDVQKRFGRWDDILAEPAPPAYLPVTTAIWRAHRAIAYAAKKDIPAAEHEYELFREAKDGIAEDAMLGDDKTHRVLDVSDRFIAGEIALQQDDWDRAAELLEEGAQIEDTLSYGEPPQWLQPVRHTLGAVYLKAGRWEDAERVYRQDLAKWRGNGWSLYGLARALEEQGRLEEAAAARSEHERAWALADAPTKTSCVCIPEA